MWQLYLHAKIGVSTTNFLAVFYEKSQQLSKLGRFSHVNGKYRLLTEYFSQTIKTIKTIIEILALLWSRSYNLKCLGIFKCLIWKTWQILEAGHDGACCKAPLNVFFTAVWVCGLATIQWLEKRPSKFIKILNTLTTRIRSLILFKPS